MGQRSALVQGRVSHPPLCPVHGGEGHVVGGCSSGQAVGESLHMADALQLVR